MDEVDRANEEAERSLSEALRKVRTVKSPDPTGFCHWCEEPVDDWARWCSVECREDWERDLSQKRNAGLT